MSARALLSSVCGVAIVSAATWGAETRLRIDPGPESISDAERAIAADPDAGVEHGVILVDEWQLNDDYGVTSQLQRHLRAKILSNEARDLANVEIRLAPDEALTRWWGFVVLPDGQVLRLAESELTEQSIARFGRRGHRSVWAPLPGVTPGAVIDYGYTVVSEYIHDWRPIDLQRPWPVRRFAFRWKPTPAYTSVYRIYRAEGLQVDAKTDRGSVQVFAENLPAVVDEPFMPPDHEVGASMTLYYMPKGDRFRSYWDDLAANVERGASGASTGVVTRQVLAALEGSPPETLVDKLRAAYDWIGANVQNPLVDRGDVSVGLADSVSPDPVDRLFLEVARALGADAHVVLAPDRRDRLWDPDLRSFRQLPSYLVALRTGGDAVEDLVVTDPSSSLPFGQVPWWSSGVQALLATKDGAQVIVVPTSQATDNVTRTTVELTLETSGMTASWESTAQGQAGMAWAQTLSPLSDKGRRAHCGEGPDSRARRADVTVFASLSTQLRCELAVTVPTTDGAIGRGIIGWSGPWIAALPDLPVGNRVNPVLFDYPQIEFTVVTMHAPAGFLPAEAPPEERFAGPFGKYQLRVSTTADGFRVERALARFAVHVPASDYDALRAFFEDVRKADAELLTFVRAGPAP